MFHFVSHDFANFHWTWRFVLFVCCVLFGCLLCLFVFLGCCVFPVKILHSIRVLFSNFQLLTDNVSYSIGNAGKKT